MHIKFIAHNAAKIYYRGTDKKIAKFGQEASRMVVADLFMSIYKYFDIGFGQDKRPHGMKEISRRVSQMQRLFKNNNFDTDFDMEKALFDTIQMCSPPLLLKVKQYSDRRKDVNIFNKYVTGVFELTRFYASVREYRMSVRELELNNHPSLV